MNTIKCMLEFNLSLDAIMELSGWTEEEAREAIADKSVGEMLCIWDAEDILAVADLYAYGGPRSNEGEMKTTQQITPEMVDQEVNRVAQKMGTTYENVASLVQCQELGLEGIESKILNKILRIKIENGKCVDFATRYESWVA